MATAKTKQVETPVKKVLKKKTVEPKEKKTTKVTEVVDEVEVTEPKKVKKEKVETKEKKSSADKAKKATAEKPKAEKKTTKAEKKMSAKAEKPKADKKMSAKAEKAKGEASETEDEKPKRAPKKINTKPVISDVQGLNLSVAKVKNIIADLCINKDATDALNELRKMRVFADGEADDDEEESDGKKKKQKEFTFSLEGVSETTQAFLADAQEEYNASVRLAHAQHVIKNFDAAQKAEYQAARQTAMHDFHESQKKNELFLQTSFEVDKFNEQYDSSIYDDMPDLDAWKELENMELFNHCAGVINKRKVRFNSESKIFITAFVEYVIKQLITNGTRNCIANKKKIIQLKHAVSEINDDFTLFPFVSSTETCRKLMKYGEEAFEKPADEEPEDEEEQEEPEEDDDADSTAESKPKRKTSRVLQFKYYVGELCRGVRMELSHQDEDAEDFLTSRFNQTSVSRAFKQFCSDVIIDMLHIFGRMLRMEVLTRDVKTVNYDIVSSLIYGTHIVHNVHYDDTVRFIQESYNKYNDFVAERQSIRSVKQAEKKKANANGVDH